jgi:hypothetical protein
MEGKQEQISGMIHNHEVRGSFPRLATRKSVTYPGLLDRDSLSETDGEGFKSGFIVEKPQICQPF